MVRYRTTLGVSTAIGLGLGGLLVGYLVLTHQDEGVASTGGARALELQSTETPGDSADSLSVREANPENILGASVSNEGTGSIGSAGGAQGQQSGSTGAGSNANGASNAPKLPGPKDFGQYERYAAEKSAFMGDVVAGTGAEAGIGSVLTVKYRGWLSSGVLFDENYSKEPFAFKLGDHRVILGWEQGLFGMKVGGKRRLIIPPAVGYGATGQGAVGPNALMIFDVELLDVR